MKTDALSRRSRFAPPNPEGRPKKAPKRLMIQDADILVFEAINRHGPLPSNYLYQFTKHLRKDESQLKNRLTEFYNGDMDGPYLTRPPQQFAGFHARYSHLVYDLAPRAERFVYDKPAGKSAFLHQLMQACVGASIELTAPSQGYRYISRHDIMTHSKCPEDTRLSANPMAIPLPLSNTLIPDDLFGLQGADGGFDFYAVEIDRNTESIERKNLEYNTFSKKVAGYLKVLDNRLFNTQWGIPNLNILIVTTNATHAENLLAYIRKQKHPKAKKFAVAVVDTFGPNWRVPREVLSHLLTEEWKRP